jgi:hypothetical protein
MGGDLVLKLQRPVGADHVRRSSRLTGRTCARKTAVPVSRMSIACACQDACAGWPAATVGVMCRITQDAVTNHGDGLVGERHRCIGACREAVQPACRRGIDVCWTDHVASMQSEGIALRLDTKYQFQELFEQARAMLTGHRLHAKLLSQHLAEVAAVPR